VTFPESAADVVGCLACDLASGRLPLHGGLIHESEFWRVDHCVGPLGVGTLVVRPKRHVTKVAELTSEEADEQGVLLHRSAAVIERLSSPSRPTSACGSPPAASQVTFTTSFSRSPAR
jgi:diadenosine tetraphosphate (Ap4A) HIT family hydrolase